jgi:hypothetical protein
MNSGTTALLIVLFAAGGLATILITTVSLALFSRNRHISRSIERSLRSFVDKIANH